MAIELLSSACVVNYLSTIDQMKELPNLDTDRLLEIFEAGETISSEDLWDYLKPSKPTEIAHHPV